jgi:outer membrane protein OmpA-like peptidoglycan-associated protein
MKKTILLIAIIVVSVIAKAQTKTIIHFDSNKKELNKSSIHLLDSLANFIKTASNYEISINGYCDNTGNDANNQTLSERRATELLTYFKNKNIATQFISAQGFLSSNPVASNENEIGKAKNRRAEIIITVNTPIVTEVIQEHALQEITPPNKPIEKKEAFSTTSSINDLEVGKTLILENLNFEGGTAVLLPEAKPTLELLLKTLKNNPTVEIEIGGHVCCADDMPLSVLRAQSVYNYLIKKGIDESRLKYKGYSRSKPIYENDKTPFEARANRRVEITVLKK